jgi:hypothetical protein
MAEMKKYGATSVGPESLSDAERPSDNLEIDEIMAKLEQVREIIFKLNTHINQRLQFAQFSMKRTISSWKT